MFCRSLNLFKEWKYCSKLIIFGLLLFSLSSHAINQTSFLLQDASGKDLCSHHPDAMLIPASNMKLLSLATVLVNLKPESTLETKVWFDGEELSIVGSGDPAISARYSNDSFAFFRKVSGALKAKKVSHIEVLSADVSLFTGPVKPTTWSVDDEPFYYAADLSPLSYEDNCVEFKSWNREGKINSTFSPYIKVIDHQKSSLDGQVIEAYHQDGNVFTVSSTIPVGESETEYLSIKDPALYTLFELKQFLNTQGITVGRLVVYHESKNYPKHNLLLTHQSPKILQLVTTAMQRSNNFITEMLTWTAAAKVYKKGSWKNAVKLINSFLRTHKLTGFQVDDSCGLSRLNRASATAIVDLLEVTKSIENYRSTLKTMRVGEQLVEYKTGSMSGVLCMSGYMGDSVFSILINAPGESRAKLETQMNNQLQKFCQLLSKGEK